MPALRTIAFALASSCILTLSGCASAEPPPPPGSLSASEARADLDRLYAGLKSADAGLFQATPEPLFDARFEELHRSYTGPVETAVLHADFQRFAALARHAHTRLAGLNLAWGSFASTDGHVFPLRIEIDDGEVVVAAAPEGSGARAGDRLVGLDGEPNPIWLARVTRAISAETPEFAHAQLVQGLPYFIWLEHGPQETFTVDVERDGERMTLEMDAISLSDFISLEPAGSGPSLEGREARTIKDGIAYLRPGPFWDIDADTPDKHYAPEGLAAYTGFIDSAFDSFIDASADHLILDLRDNPGGDNSFSDPVVAWFADRPFRFASEFLIRISPESIASNQARLDAMENPAGSTSQELADLYEGAEIGTVVNHELPFVQPRTGPRFEGEVHVLVNRGSYSNAVTTAALIQDYGFGTVYGEPTRDMATIYGAMESFTLPHSGFKVDYPKALIIRPNGKRTPHALTPDVLLPGPRPGSEGDMMLDALLDRIDTL